MGRALARVQRCRRGQHVPAGQKWHVELEMPPWPCTQEGLPPTLAPEGRSPASGCVGLMSSQHGI